MKVDNESIGVKRRKYNQFVASESIEDYALRYTPASHRKWSIFTVANTAFGNTSFLALEAIGASIAISYGFENAFWGILVASIIIFLMGIPICYHAAKNHIDIDLLTRSAGFGYIGSTFTSLIYASFCFILFAIEASIMAQALYLYSGLPLSIGYALCSVIIIPIVFYGMSAISRLQTLTQPVWLILMILPFIAVINKEPELLSQFFSFTGDISGSSEFSGYYFGFSVGISLALIAQIGEQVDYLRFMPDKNKNNSFKWWSAVILAGPGWIIVGFLKQLGGILLASLLIITGATALEIREPIHMYNAAYEYVVDNKSMALTISLLFVIISQIKINVTNAYAGSLAWSNFFSRITHSHPGRVVWLIFNISIALFLMEMGVFDILQNILGLYSVVAIAWISAMVADLVINKPLGLSPAVIEFKRAYLFDINPVGVFSTAIASIVGILCFAGFFGDQAQAFSALIALAISFILVPIIAWITKGKYYIARKIETFDDSKTHQCGVCNNEYHANDMATCPMYNTAICSLCCSLESRCHDMCKPNSEFKLSKNLSTRLDDMLSPYLQFNSSKRLIRYVVTFIGLVITIGLILVTTYTVRSIDQDEAFITIIKVTYINLFYLLSLMSLIAAWLIVLMHEDRELVESELNDKNEALNKSKSRYHQIFEKNSLVKLLVNPENGKIIDFNDAAIQYYGYEAKEFSSLYIYDISVLSEEKSMAVVNDINTGILSTFSTQHKLASGEIRDVEVYPCAIETKQGPLNYAMIVDVTERLDVENKLKQSEDLLELAMSVANDGIWDWDMVTASVKFDDRYYTIAGYKPKEFPQQFEEWKNRVHEDDIDSVLHSVQQYSQGKIDKYDISFRFLRSDNTYMWIRGRGKIVEFSDDGIPLRFIGTHSDITEIKLNEEALTQSSKMKAIGQLASGIAHDFNNILAIISGNLELISMDNSITDKTKHRFKDIKSSTERAIELTRNMLGFSRFEATQTQVVDMNTTLDNLIGLIAKSLTPIINIDFKAEKSLWPVNINITEFDSSILNLAINARDAMPKGGNLTITTMNMSIKDHASLPSGDYVKLEIFDTGTGIEKLLLNKIFDPFFTTKDQGKGTGLGLSIAFGFMARSRGDISAESEVGEGTRFKLLFPRYIGTIPDEKQLPETRVNESVENNALILIVDDEISLLDIAKESLTLEGYDVLTADSGNKALEILAAEPKVKLLVSDIVMPQMNGYLLADKVASKYPEIKILLTSGDTTKAVLEVGHDDNEYNLLHKPYSLSDLKQSVQMLINSK